MKLKKDLELVPFLKDVKQCQADVWLRPAESEIIFDTMHFGCHAG